LRQLGLRLPEHSDNLLRRVVLLVHESTLSFYNPILLIGYSLIASGIVFGEHLTQTSSGLPRNSVKSQKKAANPCEFAA
ncbi:MAG: hypothetical protein ABFD90_07790, partial [Phycisphaerales bacterium]